MHTIIKLKYGWNNIKTNDTLPRVMLEWQDFNFQDLLEDDEIKLDTNFKQSLTMDLVQVWEIYPSFIQTGYDILSS